MFKITLSAFTVALLALGFIPNPAQAQSRVFVAAQGSDGNPCSFAAPCRTFQHAHDVVSANGEINVLDPAGYGTLTISKSISIQGHGFAGITATSATGIMINAAVGDVINLRGLIIDGAGTGSSGVWLAAAGTLNIQDCVVRNFTDAGITLFSSSSVNIAVANTTVSDNRDGIFVGPNQFNVVFNQVQSYHNRLSGIAFVAGSSLDSAIVAAVVESVAANNGQFGIFASGVSQIHVMQIVTWGNGTQGVRAENFADIFVARSMLDGWSNGPNACVASYGDNYVAGGLQPPCGANIIKT
jgi:hypothetical protein